MFFSSNKIGLNDIKSRCDVSQSVQAIHMKVLYIPSLIVTDCLLVTIIQSSVKQVWACVFSPPPLLVWSQETLRVSDWDWDGLITLIPDLLYPAFNNSTQLRYADERQISMLNASTWGLVFTIKGLDISPLFALL